MIINKGNYGETLYTVTIGTSTAWTKEFKVYAYNETEAVDLVADYIEEQEMKGLYADYYEIFDCAEVGQTVDEYAEANNLTCCGNHGIYIQVINIEEGIKMYKQGQLIAVNGAIYEYMGKHNNLHMVSEVEIDEDGHLTATYCSRYVTDAELKFNEIQFTKQQWYGIVEHFIRQDYDDFTEEEIMDATEDIVGRCFAYGIPQFEELSEYIADCMNR